MEKIGTCDQFHSKTCYNLYMYALSLAKQVNNYIEKDYLVVYKGHFLNKFVFYNELNDEPYIGERNGNTTYIWFGSVFDKNGKVCLCDDYTKEKIRNKFEEIKIYNPDYKEKLKF